MPWKGTPYPLQVGVERPKCNLGGNKKFRPEIWSESTTKRIFSPKRAFPNSEHPGTKRYSKLPWKGTPYPLQVGVERPKYNLGGNKKFRQEICSERTTKRIFSPKRAFLNSEHPGTKCYSGRFQDFDPCFRFQFQNTLRSGSSPQSTVRDSVLQSVGCKG